MWPVIRGEITSQPDQQGIIIETFLDQVTDKFKQGLGLGSGKLQQLVCLRG